MSRGLRSQAEARQHAISEGMGQPMAIILTTDDDGVATHEHCPERMVETLYGVQIRGEIARVVEVIR